MPYERVSWLALIFLFLSQPGVIKPCLMCGWLFANLAFVWSNTIHSSSQHRCEPGEGGRRLPARAWTGGSSICSSSDSVLTPTLAAVLQLSRVIMGNEVFDRLIPGGVRPCSCAFRGFCNLLYASRSLKQCSGGAIALTTWHAARFVWVDVSSSVWPLIDQLFENMLINEGHWEDSFSSQKLNRAATELLQANWRLFL